MCHKLKCGSIYECSLTDSAMENDEEEEMRSFDNSLDDESAVDESAVDDSALFGEQDQENDDFFQDVSSEVCFGLLACSKFVNLFTQIVTNNCECHFFKFRSCIQI